MKVSVLVATHGDPRWEELAFDRAVPSIRAAAGDLDHEVLTCHEPDGTLACTRNALAEQASGDWFCFLDADDELEPGYLMAMAKAWLAHRGTGEWISTNSGPRPTRAGRLVAPPLLVPAVRYVSRGEPVGDPEIPAWGQPLIDINCAVIGTLVPRYLFEQVGGFEEWSIYEDWDLWLRCILAGARLVPVPDAVYTAHVSETSRNRQPEIAAAVYHQIRARHLPHYTPGMERSTT